MALRRLAAGLCLAAVLGWAAGERPATSVDDFFYVGRCAAAPVASPARSRADCLPRPSAERAHLECGVSQAGRGGWASAGRRGLRPMRLAPRACVQCRRSLTGRPPVCSCEEFGERCIITRKDNAMPMAPMPAYEPRCASAGVPPWLFVPRAWRGLPCGSRLREACNRPRPADAVRAPRPPRPPVWHCHAPACPAPPRGPASTLSFVSVGDWGCGATNCDTKPDPNHQSAGEQQAMVSRLMDSAAEAVLSSFVLALGDNFYFRGVKDAHDPLFQEVWQTRFTGQGLMTPWYIFI